MKMILFMLIYAYQLYATNFVFGRDNIIGDYNTVIKDLNVTIIFSKDLDHNISTLEEEYQVLSQTIQHYQKEIQQLNKEKNRLEKDQKVNTKLVKTLKQKIQKNKTIIESLQKTQLHLHSRITQLESKLNQINIKSNQITTKLNLYSKYIKQNTNNLDQVNSKLKKDSTLIQQNSDAIEKLRGLHQYVKQLDTKLSTLKQESNQTAQDLYTLENRYEKMEERVSLLGKRVSTVERKINLINKKALKIDQIAIGGGATLEETIGYLFEIQGEWDIEKIPLSLFLNLAYTKEKKELEYTVLNQKNLLNDDKQFLGLKLGVRYYLNSIIYTRLSGGVEKLFESKNNEIEYFNYLANINNNDINLVGDIALGLEYNHFLVNLGYLYHDIEYVDTVQFNPLGEGKLQTKDGLGRFYVSIKYLWSL